MPRLGTWPLGSAGPEQVGSVNEPTQALVPRLSRVELLRVGRAMVLAREALRARIVGSWGCIVRWRFW